MLQAGLLADGWAFGAQISPHHRGASTRHLGWAGAVLVSLAALSFEHGKGETSMTSALLTARIGPYLFGAPVSAVTEILSHPAVTRIPRTPPLVAGVAVVRGQPLAVFTLRSAVGLDLGPVSMALRWAGPSGVALVAVDQVQSLWQPRDPLPPDAWNGLVPGELIPWIASGHRVGQEWLWAWPEDLPERFQHLLMGGISHGG